MHQLTILGLGPGGKQYLTLEALECIKEKKKIYARTMKHPVMSYLMAIGGDFEGLDYLYERGQTFEEVYESIADKIVEMLKTESVTYAVPGNPFVAEKTVELLLSRVDEKQIKIIHGASFIDAIITTLHIDPVHGLKIIDGLKIEDSRLDALADALIIQVYDQEAASRVKLSLMSHYEDEHEVWVVRGAGIPGEEIIEKMPLFELDRSTSLDHLTSVYIPRVLPENRQKFVLEDLVAVIDTLRGDEGCPWDKVQTHESLKKALIEETYEVIQTIDDEDLWGLEEELGDLLLQVVFHSQIASEQGYFTANDVITGIYNKMVRRHPHVFLDDKAEHVEEVLEKWESIKETENKSQEIPKSFPPILRTEKIIKKAKKYGLTQEFFENVESRLLRHMEEVVEFDPKDNPQFLSTLIGKIIFDLVYVASKVKIDANTSVLDYGEWVIDELEKRKNDLKSEK